MTTIADRYALDPVHIGKGGMGEVWGATDTRLRRRVAVKFVRFGDDPELVRRFVRESQLTARMGHPGVPVLYDADKVKGGPFDGRFYSCRPPTPSVSGTSPARAAVRNASCANPASTKRCAR